MEISWCTPIPLFWATDQSTVAQRTETTVGERCNTMPGYIVCPLPLRWISCICVFTYSLPFALLAEWPGSFTLYSGDTEMERIPKWQSAPTVNSGEKKKKSLPRIEPATFWSWVRRSITGQYQRPMYCCLYTRINILIVIHPRTTYSCLCMHPPCILIWQI